ncbi:MAG: isopeptide-forming domain-containing fimbrial protein, partial [Acetobacteraceae bacterium]|nr:isopeptide-forming domain-containing fimbrial protein [Acetobacteraceae bacterium]
LTLVAGSATLALLPAGGATISEAGGVIRVTAPVMLPGEVLRFTYQARVEPTVVAGTTLPNTVEARGDSHPGVPPTGVQRPFTLSASDSVAVPGPGILKTVSEIDTSLPETGSVIGNSSRVDLAIGEIVTYRLTVTLSEAVSTGLTVRDLLPGSVAVPAASQGLFEFLSASVTRIGTSLSGPGLLTATPVAGDLSGDGILDSVTIAFGDVTNTPDGILNAEDQIEIAVTARVRDAAVNRAGQAPINTATVAFGGATQSASAQVDIVEPNLFIDKDTSRTTGDAGDRVAFAVSVPFSGVQSGPAFNVTVTDTVPVGFNLDTATLQFVTLPLPGSTLSYDSLTRTITAVIPTYQFINGVVQFRYEAVVDNGVAPQQVLTNTATVTWTSHPGTPPTEYQRDYGPRRDSTSFAVDILALSKRVVATDIPATGIPPGQTVQDVAIGETVTYLLTLRLPEATTNLVLTDLLPRSIGAPLTAGDMRLFGAEIVSVGANITGAGIPPIGDPGVQTDSNADGILDRVAWDFGLVTNLADNIQDAEDLIVVRVVARVIDVPANQPGDLLVNTGQAQYTRANGSTALITQTETVRIVGPELAITKTPLPGSGDAGDLVTYTLTISHVGGVSSADAYALTLTDLLEPRLALVAGSVTASIPGAIVVTGNAPGDTTIRVTLDQYALGAAAFTITYQARLTDAVRPGTSIPNSADLAWQSAPAGFVDARPDSATASNVVNVVFPSTLSKVVTGTSLPETPDAGVPDLTPGETVTYTLTLTLGEGTQRVLLTDTLPTGLGFVSGQVVSIGSNISGALLGVGAVPVVSGNLLTFDFGNAVVNAGDNVIDARDRITVQVTARLLDLPANTQGTVLVNSAAFTTDNATRTATAPVEVVLPRPVIAKDASIPSGDAGDLVTFTVVVSQAAGATGPLYDLNVTDLLPAAYVLVAGSAVASRGTATESGNGVTLSLPGLSLLAIDIPQTPFDDTRVTLTYQARLAHTVEPGQVVTNIAAFTGGSAPSGTPEARPFTGNDPATVTVVMPVALDKQILATSLPGTPGSSVAIGETITYRLTATLSEGTQTLVIRDTLPGGLEALSASVFALGAGVTAGAPVVTILGQSVTLDFGTVVNAGNNIAGDGTVAIDILARVRDVPGNVSGTALTNAGSVTITSPTAPGAPGGTQTDSDTTTATVVAPVLLLDKAVPPGFARPGEVLTYTLTLTHGPGSTAAAHDIVLADLLADPNLDLVAGTVTTTLGTIVLGNAPGDTTIRIELGTLALGDSITITYGALVLATTPPGTTLTNSATAAWDSNPGPGGRPDTATDGTATPLVPGFAKVIASTSNPDTGSGQLDPAIPDLAVGETLTYRLTITLPQGTTDALTLSDLLPAGLLPLAARVAAVGAGLTLGAPVINIAGQAVSIGFGSVVNASGPGIGPEDLITVEIDARVVDLPGLVAGAPLVNAAALDFSIGGRTGSLAANAPAELVEPALTIAKSVNQPSGDAGDVFTYTVTIAQAPGATAPAYDITVTDLVDPRLVPLTVNASTGTATISGNTISLTLPRLLLTDPSVTLTYTVRMADAVEPGQMIPNIAALGWDSNPGPGGRAGSGSAAAQVAVALTLGLDKAIVATSLPQTTSGQILPGVTDLAIGEEVTYEIVARLGEGTQTLVISDAMPTGLLPLPGGAVVVSTGASISAGPGGTLTPTATISGQSVSFDFGTLVNAGDNVSDAGDLVTVRITARVLDLPINTVGRIVDNSASAVAASPSDPGAPGGTLTAADSVPAAIVLPNFTVDKAVDRGTGDAGDVFTYTLVVAPTAGNTGPAFNVLISDPLSPFLAVVPGSLTSSVGTPSIVGNTIQVAIPVLAANAPPVTITYRAAFTDAIEPGQVVVNTATFDYASAPGAGRQFGGDDSVSVQGDFTLDLAKAIVATSIIDTGTGAIIPGVTDLAIGEIVTYELVARLSEGTQRLVITDTLPLGLLPE